MANRFTAGPAAENRVTMRSAPEPLPVTADPGLFAALGGRAAVGLIVDGLYDRLERDPELTRLFRSRRKGERDRLKEFFEGLFGGEVRGIRDVGTQRRHLHRLISAEESARWLAHFGAAIDRAGVAAGPQAAVLRLLQEAAARLENDGAPLEALRQAMAAAGQGDVDAVAALVADHPRLIDQRAGDGATMLWTAARRGRLPLVRWLTEHGADIEIPGACSSTTAPGLRRGEPGPPRHRPDHRPAPRRARLRPGRPHPRSGNAADPGVPGGQGRAPRDRPGPARARRRSERAEREGTDAPLDRGRRPVRRHRRAAARRGSALTAEFRQTRLR